SNWSQQDPVSKMASCQEQTVRAGGSEQRLMIPCIGPQPRPPLDQLGVLNRRNQTHRRSKERMNRSSSDWFSKTLVLDGGAYQKPSVGARHKVTVIGMHDVIQMRTPHRQHLAVSRHYVDR